ncbi:MAG: hypothetical protein R3F11_27245 [Verrucomicrobiales bacterium]
MQESLHAQRRAGEIGDTVLLLEHEPVYTISGTRDQSSLRGGSAALPHPVFEDRARRAGDLPRSGSSSSGILIFDLAQPRQGFACLHPRAGGMPHPCSGGARDRGDAAATG